MKILNILAITVGINVFSLLVILYTGKNQPLDLWDPVFGAHQTKHDPDKVRLDQSFPFWMTGNQWDRYQRQLNTKGRHGSTVNQKDYCSIRENWIVDHEDHILPKNLRKELNVEILSDTVKFKIEQNNFDKLEKLPLKDKWPVINQTVNITNPSTPLDANTDIFFALSRTWEKYHEIGKHFLCGNQRYNHIPGSQFLTQKHAIAKLFKDYSKDLQPECKDVLNFYPNTYDMSKAEQCTKVITSLKNDDRQQIKWVEKLTTDIRSKRETTIITPHIVDEILDDFDMGQNWQKQDALSVMQQYIQNQMMINNEKFQIRAHLIIANVKPLLVVCDNFVVITSNADGTRQMQSSDEAEHYLVNTGVVEPGWAADVQTQIIKNAYHLVSMARLRLLPHPGVFEYFNMDYIMDTSQHMWLIDVGGNPWFHGSDIGISHDSAQLIATIVNIQSVLVADDLEGFNQMVDDNNFHWVYNEREKVPYPAAVAPCVSQIDDSSDIFKIKNQIISL